MEPNQNATGPGEAGDGIGQEDMPQGQAGRGTPGRELGRVFREAGYLLPGFPLWVAMGTVVITGIAVGVGTAVLWVGLGLLAVTLAMAHGFAEFDLLRLAAAGRDLRPARALMPPRPRGGGWRWTRPITGVIRDPMRWREAGYAVAMIPLTTLTWAITLMLWTMAVSGLTSVIWEPIVDRAAAGDPTVTHVGIADLLHLGVPNWVPDTLLGFAAAGALPLAMHGLTALHALVARALLVPGNRAFAQRVAELESARDRASAAETQSLRRIERDIHDGPQQQLVRLGMDLATAQRRLDEGDGAAADAVLADARARLGQAIGDLRALSRGIAPPILQDRGLAAALSAVAASLTVPAQVVTTPPDAPRLPEAQETALYFAACELLANVAKHSGAATARVALDVPPGAGYAELTVADAGRGGAVFAPGHGLAGLRDRLAGVDGTIQVTSSAAGTAATVRVPVAP
ncbi:MAG: sensor domain-containing protein [Bifidobacteriaceae bacterium]|jgi:signal transduction histidine kinase|nr:sensor domain-containing protein [Bifidobacteriaceae bacterium]